MGDRVREDFRQIEEDAATLVEGLHARLDLKVLADSEVKGVKRGFRVPEEVGDVEHVGCCIHRISSMSIYS